MSAGEQAHGRAVAWTLDALDAALRTSLRDLPGVRAQALLAPKPRRGWRPSSSVTGVRLAAALVLFYPRHEQPHLVLTVRSGGLPHHGGQVSFPGGAMEPGEAVASAALREAAEEIGIDPSRVRVLGALTPLHIPVSDFLVHPVVGLMDEPPVFVHAAAEVAKVLEVPLGDLFDRSRLRTTTWVRDGDFIEVPYFAVAGEQVWGATAMMLSELLWVLGERTLQDGDRGEPRGTR